MDLQVNVMLTVKDINNKKFDAIRGGYPPLEVDDYLKQCANALKAAEAVNEDMREKLTILADNVREYQKKEADIAGAFLDIQKAKRYALEDAGAEARKIINDAHEQAKAILGNTSSKLRSEALAYERMKKEVALFKDSILAMYKEHLNILTAIPEDYDEAEGIAADYNTETDDGLPVSGVLPNMAAEAADAIPLSPAESFAEPEVRPDTSDQTELYKQAFGAKPVPGRSDKFDALKFGQTV
jgi:cell division initiation protein